MALDIQVKVKLQDEQGKTLSDSSVSLQQLHWVLSKLSWSPEWDCIGGRVLQAFVQGDGVLFLGGRRSTHSGRTGSCRWILRFPRSPGVEGLVSRAEPLGMGPGGRSWVIQGCPQGESWSPASPPLFVVLPHPTLLPAVFHHGPEPSSREPKYTFSFQKLIISSILL